MQENYLAKWLNNELSEEELAEFKNSVEYDSYQKLKEASGSLEAPKFDADKIWSSLKDKRESSKSKVIQLRPFTKLLRVAAAIAVIAVASIFYFNSLDETISTQYAERAEVLLPDASEIVLNADSEVSYSKKKWDKKRNVSLKGEAYFKVAKGKRFTVTTDEGTVAVLGTQFNVENRKGLFEVTCFEGLVSVTFQNKEFKVPAGSSFLAINGEVRPTIAPTTTIPYWMNHESNFKSIPLSYVLDEFERQYNVTVEIKDVDTNQLFTGTFSNTDIDLALESISVPANIQFKKLDGNKVVFYAEETP
ncbi:FecR family protein [Flavobacteriaceae bacterium KMM 6897]|nr:FecR family protein [Flavobacteriaceae bacterium KMM 6897]MEB8344922.1 FecR family protein [Flavobacteriaceae bacterium KMM 6898]